MELPLKTSRRYYNANGLRITVESIDKELQQAFTPYLEPFARPAETGVNFTVTMVRGDADGPLVGTCIFDGDIMPGVGARLVSVGSESWLLVPGQLAIRFNGTGTAAEITAHATCSKRMLSYTAIHVIDAALAASGQYLVHGAALALPGGGDGALLLVAPSGSGKTTTALALALNGFALMTDDAIVLQPTGFGGQTSAFAWGLPRALKVHRKTATLLPAIAPLLHDVWDEHDEQVLTGATLSRVARVADAKPAKIAAIAVLGRRTAADHQLLPLSKATALKLLAEDNIRRTPEGLSPTQVARFKALSSLIVATPTYELCVGERLPELGREVLSVLRQPRRS